MKIQGKEIIADDGMLIRRIGQGTGFKKCILLADETEKTSRRQSRFLKTNNPKTKYGSPDVHIRKNDDENYDRYL